MTTPIKATVTVVIGLIAYLIIGLIHNGSLTLPTSGSEIIILLVTVATAIGGYILGSGSSQPSFSDDRETGTVKWFNVKKGYGFITRDQGDDVFVHYRNIEGEGRRAISEGQRVSFVVISGDKGPQADQVLAT